MDRRAFLTGVGTVGAATAGGFAASASSDAKARAGDLAKAARGGSTPGVTPRPPTTRAATIEGLTLGYLPGSAGLFAIPAKEAALAASTVGLRWAKWSASMGSTTSVVGRVLRTESMINVAIGALQRADSPAAKELLFGLDITAHFSINGVQRVAQFYPWSYTSSKLRGRAASSPPLRFDAYTPDRMALQVDYALNPATIAASVKSAGMVYMPVGSSGGPANGLYVLAGPSHTTGLPPVLAAHVFSGDLAAPILQASGAEPDFDFVTLAIRPVVA